VENDTLKPEAQAKEKPEAQAKETDHVPGNPSLALQASMRQLQPGRA
jgi:hypothetical protein